MCHKRKLKFQDCKNCVEEAQIENKINHLEKSKIDVDSLKQNQKEFIKNNKLILKTQQRFRSEEHSVFTEEINKIADKLMIKVQSVDLIEIYAHGASKDLVYKKEEIKCNNIIKQYKDV